MESLINETNTPRISAFLDNVDKVMNSNTIFLKGRTDEVITNQNCQMFLEDYFQMPLFTQMMLEADKIRGLFNYHEWVDTDYQPRSNKPMARSSPILPKLTRMSIIGLAERLHWMLRLCFSPYSTHIGEPEAYALIKDFFEEIFGAWDFDQKPENWIGFPYWVKSDWTFYDVAPYFLYSTEYGENNPPPDEIYEIAYFDGWNSDTCTLFFKDDIFYMLLTNGSP